MPETVELDRDLETFEVARVCRVDEETVRRWIRAGELAAYNVGGSGAQARYRVTSAALAAFRSLRATKSSVVKSARVVRSRAK